MSGKATMFVGFVGSGAVNFGQEGLPWNHASRLEVLSQEYDVRFGAIADPDVTKAEATLAKRRANATYGKLWADCVVYKGYAEMLASTKLTAVFVGVPPVCHGTTDEGNDVELACLRAGVHVFIEKPVSLHPVDRVREYCAAVKKVTRESPTPLITSVGYMFRYAKAIQKMKELVETHAKGRIVGVCARYQCTYPTIDHPFWWDVRRSGGPIVEQGTHFVDLIRYLGGEVDPSSVSGVCVTADEPSGIGALAKMPPSVDESKIPAESRVPRATMCTMKLKGGGVASLNHGICLQGTDYDAGIQVWCDGLRLSLENAYLPSKCRLLVRVGKSDTDEVFTFENDDPYLTEAQVFLQAIQSGSPSNIMSSYEDGVATYDLTCTIREATTPNSKL